MIARGLRYALAAGLLVCACSDDDVVLDTGSDSDVDARAEGGLDAEPRDVGRDTPLEDGGLDVSADVGDDTHSGGETVAVAHARELRAIWVATVFGLDFPSRTGLSAAAARSELEAIVERSAECGFNALFFQVRPESDALYESTLEPWSRFLAGSQGSDPGYDPLAVVLSAAHARGLEVHAWMNPFRGMTSTSITPDARSPVRRFPDAAEVHGTGIHMNPASTALRTHLLSVVADLVGRYDLDGVVFDDYFYPYPGAGPYDDDAEFGAYTSAGGTLARGDWRRENINAVVESVGTTIHATKAWARWGVSPFGIYRPNMPPGVVGLDAYEEIAADSLRWLESEWVDYLSPQLYWSTASSGQPFGPLVAWWAGLGTAERPIVPALGLYRFGTAAEWTLEEFASEVALTRDAAPATAGNSWFRYGNLANAELRAMVQAQYATPSRPPPVPGYLAEVAPPAARAVAGGVLVDFDESAVRGAMIYAEGDEWTPLRWLPASESAASLPIGRYAVSAIDHGGVESLGRIVEVR